MTDLRWQSASGWELETAFLRSESLSEILVGGPALYLWKRNLKPPRAAVLTGNHMKRWIDECLGIPYGVLPEMSLSHFLKLHGISIGGESLTEEKKVLLKQWVQDPLNRQLIVNFLTTLNDFAPPLYVGETVDLPRRVREHLNGDSDFAIILKQRIKLSWNRLTLCYITLPDQFGAGSSSGKELRTLIEMIAARLALAFCTRRPG